MKSSQLRGRYIRILAFFAGVIARFILWEIFFRYLGLRGWVRRTRKDRSAGGRTASAVCSQPA